LTSLRNQLAALLGVSENPPGSWFLVSNEELFVDGQRWAPKQGSHPAMVVAIRGPHYHLMPRSASNAAGRPHEAHPSGHSKGSICRVTKNGYVKTKTHIRVAHDVLERSAFSCFEPDTSGLLVELGIS
jgi:hypothetical protein